MSSKNAAVEFLTPNASVYDRFGNRVATQLRGDCTEIGWALNPMCLLFYSKWENWQKHKHIECLVNMVAGNCDCMAINKEHQRLPANLQNLRQRQGTDPSPELLKGINHAGILSFDF